MHTSVWCLIGLWTSKYRLSLTFKSIYYLKLVLWKDLLNFVMKICKTGQVSQYTSYHTVSNGFINWFKFTFKTNYFQPCSARPFRALNILGWTIWSNFTVSVLETVIDLKFGVVLVNFKREKVFEKESAHFIFCFHILNFFLFLNSVLYNLCNYV